ncbi:MAG TPA: hypothetical protein VN325_23205 [Steroidobacteraceae bacterium]|nr:hypothetical protein [Steroidobacteraceae bacterium]
MITRVHGDIQFECDECAEVLDTRTSEFSEALTELKVEGWRSRKLGNDWSHYCEKCWVKQ